METLLFVYGSIRKGHHNHHRLGNSEYLGTYKTVEPFKMFGLRSRAYPYVYPDTTGCPVTGELYAVNEERLERIDCMEGHPDVYCRTPVLLQGFSEPVHMYLLVDADIKKILQKYGELSHRFMPVPSGDWADITAIRHNQPMQTSSLPSST